MPLHGDTVSHCAAQQYFNFTSVDHFAIDDFFVLFTHSFSLAHLPLFTELFIQTLLLFTHTHALGNGRCTLWTLSIDPLIHSLVHCCISLEESCEDTSLESSVGPFCLIKNAARWASWRLIGERMQSLTMAASIDTTKSAQDVYLCAEKTQIKQRA